jgi:hypothetical protein
MLMNSAIPYSLYTVAKRPDLVPQMKAVPPQIWPAFMLEDPIASHYWDKLYTVFAEYQSVFVDSADSIVGTGYTIPFVWDGDPQTLPQGWDGVIERGFADHEAGREPNAISALSAEILPTHQGKGLSTHIIQAMRGIGIQRGFHSLVAPVRPSLKPRYPLIPIERYAFWTQSDGLPFDPWMRVHARLGAEILAVSPRSMYIPGTVAQWEQWTGMAFPESGQYIIEGACEPVRIEHESDLGEYYDPNVWMKHTLTNRA